MSKTLLVNRLTKKIDEEKYKCLHQYFQLDFKDTTDQHKYYVEIADKFIDAFVAIDPIDGCKNWEEILKIWPSFDESRIEYYKSFFLEGFVDKYGDLDKKNEIGIYGEMLMNLFIEEEVKPIIYSPKIAKRSTDTQPDYITIEGDSGDSNSLYVRIWECKSSDEENTQSSKVYKQLDKRARRNSGSIAKMLIIENDIDETSEMGKFLFKLPSIMLRKSEQYRCNAFFVFGTWPKNKLLKDFEKKVVGLHSEKNRTIHLIYVPNFKDIRNELWERLKIIS